MAARTRSLVVAAVAMLAGLVAAGCATPPMLDGSATPEEALARVQATADKVTEARSARLSMSSRTMFAGEEVAASTSTTEGVYDYAAHKGQMDTTFKTAGLPFRFTERTLIISPDVYVRMDEPPGLPEPPDSGPGLAEEPQKPWVKFEVPKELAGEGGFEPGIGLGISPGLGEGPGGDPTQALEYLTTATKADVVGAEEIRGVPTVRYAVTFDASEQAAQPPTGLEGMAEMLDFAFPKPADVWVDDQGRLRKVHYAATMKLPAEGTSSQMTIETTLELYDYGVQVDVTPPPADQVEVIKDIPPPGCTPEKGNAKAGKRDANDAEAQACLEFLESFSGGGETNP